MDLGSIFIAIRTRDIDIAIPSVCLSVRDVPVSDENGLTYCHSFFSPYVSPIILVISASNIFTKFHLYLAPPVVENREIFIFHLYLAPHPGCNLGKLPESGGNQGEVPVSGL